MSCSCSIRNRPPPRTLAWLIALACLLSACARSDHLLRPNGVAVAADGSLYVMDRGNYRVVHLAASGRFLGAFGRLGTASEDIYSGWDIALDSQGQVYICNLTFAENNDLLYDGVKVFAAEGSFLRQVGRQEYLAGSMDMPNRPYGLDIDSQDRLYVTDFAVNTLRIFSAQGDISGTFFGKTGSGDGEFNGLNDVAVDDQRGLVYLSDSINSRVQQFALSPLPSGGLTLTHQLSFGVYGDEPGQFSYPQYLAVDDERGIVYVADLGNQRVQAFDAQGNLTRVFTLPDIHIWQPMGLTLGKDGAIYVADSFNNMIWVFEPGGSLHSRIEVK